MKRSLQTKIDKPNVYGIRKKKKINIENENDDEFPINTEILSLNSDTISAAEYLIESNEYKMCVLHQIYSILPNATTIDRELQEAVQEKTWRKFHIMGSLENECLLTRTSHYLEAINNETRRNMAEKTTVFDTFKRVIHTYTGVSIKKEILFNEFNYNEKEISFLVSFGFLLPQPTTIDLYWFSIPEQGRFMSNLLKGRTEILKIIKKRNTRDVLEKNKLLKQKKLHKTKFNIEFLMHDLIGSGRVEKYSTTMGNLIRLTNKGEKGI